MYLEENRDIEIEATCHSRIGYIFYEIFKIESKSEAHVKEAVNLGLSLFPKNVSLIDWYKTAADILNKIRKKKEDEENKIESELRKKIKTENEEIFKKLDAEFKKSCDNFLKYIIANHPPYEGFSFNVEAETNKTSLKKVLLKLIPLYHPDKQSSEKDLKKKIIMDEITKCLNSKYNDFKN
jgi:hypothetical protein